VRDHQVTHLYLIHPSREEPQAEAMAFCRFSSIAARNSCVVR
jgi:hypothetical protein